MCDCLVWSWVSGLLRACLAVDDWVNSVYNLQRHCQTLSASVPTPSMWGFSFFPSSPILVLMSFLLLPSLGVYSRLLAFVPWQEFMALLFWSTFQLSTLCIWVSILLPTPHNLDYRMDYNDKALGSGTVILFCP